MSEAITVSVRPDSVAVLTFDQPGSKANVLTRELWAEFGNALAALDRRTDVKGLVLASAKPGIFIAGADLKLLANAPGPNDPEVRAFIELGLRVLEQLEALPFPTCAVIDGAALGGGLEVALACDYRVCGTNSKVQLGLPEVKLGLIPGWGGTQRLPRVLDMNRMHHASDLLTTGKNLNYQEATAYQLADVVVESSILVEPAAYHVLRIDRKERRAWKLQPLPKNNWKAFKPNHNVAGAAAEAVRVMIEGAALPLYDAIKLETEAFMRLAGSDESKRLIAEFFASRKK
ncbi:enoyl-CoA hydratase/isomerase family protein [Gemmata sp. G18]|uniref:Enoyl-CoA hydratase/isomerase family protein n=1 Tax=Gemmata palustris TaxID=2822762 RepID=A0ABS5BYS8_9BACT|nr:enoyl-CoA hydratase-related protein [Gemmata palustris]MBP3958572.1 enoyl-CoA hydratase/isomerase family protein [Gemmata palustris]